MKTEGNNGTREPVQDRSRRTRQAILGAGRRLFTAKGFNGTNAKEVARTAEVAVGSFYAYFRDKGQLFLEIVDDVYRQIFERLKIRDFHEDVLKGRLHLIRSLLYGLYDAHNIEPALHREISLMLLAGTNPDFPDARYAELCRQVRERVERLDQEVLSWLMEILFRSGLEIEPDALRNSAVLVFRVAEETIHRLKQFPETLGNPDEILRELAIMLDSYLTAITKRQ